MSYLLDTCVISELISRQPDASIVRWIDDAEETSLHLSVITVGEINRGIQRLPDSARKQQLRLWLNGPLLTRFASRILPLDAATMITWGEVLADLESRGRSLPAMDSLILATARHHSLTVVTRNVKDFVDTGADVLNPWAG